MHILHVAAELAPIAKVGGLADVLLGLPKAQTQLNQQVTILLPNYDTIQPPLPNSNVNLLLLDSPDNHFKRGTIYGCSDDTERFLAFCHLAAEQIQTLKPDIVHLHDWQTCALTALIPNTILTIHNLAYQGQCNTLSLPHLDAFQKDDHYNLLAGGIRLAKQVTTVSPTYAKEALTPEYGCGLEPLLQENKKKFHGILNGIDTDYWNPKTDPHLSHHYDADSLETKAKLKAELQAKLGLKQDLKKPLIASVTRLVPQKGPEYIKEALHYSINNEAQFVLLGSSPIEEIQNDFSNLKDPNLATCLEYNEELAHQIYAAADLFIVPSLFEPCGLTQMIALRYGTLPLVRMTGGLADTIKNEINGFTFETELTPTLAKAIETWYEKPEKWKKIQQTGITTDFSWKRSAAEYLALYQKLLSPAG